MKEAKYKGIIFDLDGVILDTENGHRETYQITLAKRGIELSDRAYEENFRSKGRHHGLRAVVPGISDAEMDVVGEAKDRLFLELVGGRQELIHEDAMKIIETAAGKGLPMAIGTAGHNGKKLLESFKLYETFDVVITGRDVTHNKPNPEIYNRCQEGLAIPAESLVVIEDSAPGVRAALAAGMDVVWVIRPGAGQVDRDLAENDHVTVCDSLVVEDILV